MKPDKIFEKMLTGGHPNSLGNTVEVVDIVLSDKSKLVSLYSCYFSDDEVVRLRVSSAMKRVCKEHPRWLVPYVDRLLTEVSIIDQASTQWTLAILFSLLQGYMQSEQEQKAKDIMKRNLEKSDDWIVQNTTMQVLAEWSESDRELSKWLVPRLELFLKSPRKSVANRANKLIKQLT